MILAATALLASCNNNKNGNATPPANDSTAVADSSDADTTAAATDSLVDEGMVPAADCEGIRYRVAMDAAKKNFSMKEDYMETEKKVKETFYEAGKIAPYEKAGKKALKFTTTGNDSYYFLAVDGNTLRLVNEDLEEGVAGNYDLKLAK